MQARLGSNNYKQLLHAQRQRTEIFLMYFFFFPPVLGPVNTLHVPHSVFPDQHYSLL